MSAHLHDVRSEMRSSLKALGLRATSSRLAVLVELHEHAGPLTHEELMDRLGVGSFDKATIYRILADLTEVGLLGKMDLGDHIWRYELRDACREVADDHAHFLCEDCGEVTCLPGLELRAPTGLPAVLRGADFRVKVTGRCGDCAA